VPTAQIPLHSNQALRLSTRFGIPLREDSAFANCQGVEKRGIRKRCEKGLGTLQEPLRKILEPEEAVLYIARGQIMPSGVEQLFLGMHAYYLAPAILVLTNRRLLHFCVTRRGLWSRSQRAARWGDMEEAKVNGLLSPKLHIKYRSGKKETYWRFRIHDARKIRLLPEALLPHAAGESSSTLSIISLCPECRATLTSGVYECPNCRLKFKDEKTALRRSLLIPGGGFYYTGHLALGAAHSLADLILLFYAVIWVLVALGITHPPLGPGGKPTERFGALVVLTFLAIMLALHKWVVIRVSRNLIRNYIPAS